MRRARRARKESVSAHLALPDEHAVELRLADVLGEVPHDHLQGLVSLWLVKCVLQCGLASYPYSSVLHSYPYSSVLHSEQHSSELHM